MTTFPISIPIPECRDVRNLKFELFLNCLLIIYIDLDSDDCIPNLCLNGGTCVDGWQSFTCLCPNGYYGNLCESSIVFIWTIKRRKIYGLTVKWCSVSAWVFKVSVKIETESFFVIFIDITK